MENWKKAVNPIRCPMRLGFRVLGLRYQMEKTKEPTATAAPRGGRGAGWMDGWMEDGAAYICLHSTKDRPKVDKGISISSGS